MNKILLSLIICMFSLSNANPLPQEVKTALLHKRYEQIHTDVMSEVSGNKTVNCLWASYAKPDHIVLKKIFDSLKDVDENTLWELAQKRDSFFYLYPSKISQLEELRELREKYESMSQKEVKTIRIAHLG